MQKKRQITLEIVNECFKKTMPTISGIELVVCYLKLEKNLTLERIGMMLCISHETVRMYLNNVYKKVRRAINEDISK